MGGSSNAAQQQAQAAEAARQAAIAQTQRRIEGIYGSPEREADIQKFLDATRQYYRTDANRQQGDAARNVRFAMARSGQTGGQFDADTNSRLSETYQRGLLEADRRAQASAANLRASDQESKQRLFALAQSGLDSTTAAQNASQALRQNLSLSNATAREQSLGDLFSSFGDVYKQSVAQDESRKAQKSIYNTLYSPPQQGGGYKTGGV